MRYYLYGAARGFTLTSDCGIRIIPLLRRGHMGSRPLPQLREVDKDEYLAAGITTRRGRYGGPRSVRGNGR